jgi:hypothetical protein
MTCCDREVGDILGEDGSSKKSVKEVDVEEREQMKACAGSAVVLACCLLSNSLRGLLSSYTLQRLKIWCLSIVCSPS